MAHLDKYTGTNIKKMKIVCVINTEIKETTCIGVGSCGASAPLFLVYRNTLWPLTSNIYFTGISKVLNKFEGNYKSLRGMNF